MSEEEVRALFLLAGIKTYRFEYVENRYWPESETYDIDRVQSPWWNVATVFGMVEIGWRKRVININWLRCEVRALVTEDETTKSHNHVHAWNYAKAVEYLASLKRAAA